MKLLDSSGSQNHIVPFSNGALKLPHVDQIGAAFPLFLKFEDMVTAGQGKDGLVWGGRPVPDQVLADRLGKHRKTIAAWRRRLVKHGYITSKATPAGNVVRVRKSKKWLWLQSSKGISVASEVGAISLPDGSKSHPGGIENGIPNKTVAVQKQDVGAAAAIPPGEKWSSIGADLPMGTPAFQNLWAYFYGNRNRAPLSEAMERTIQRAQSKHVSVPRPFYEAKRRVEEAEKDPSESTWEEMPVASPNL